MIINETTSIWYIVLWIFHFFFFFFFWIKEFSLIKWRKCLYYVAYFLTYQNFNNELASRSYKDEIIIFFGLKICKLHHTCMYLEPASLKRVFGEIIKNVLQCTQSFFLPKLKELQINWCVLRSKKEIIMYSFNYEKNVSMFF